MVLDRRYAYRIESCACGGFITAPDDGDPTTIYGAVRSHQRTAIHRQWVNRREALYVMLTEGIAPARGAESIRYEPVEEGENR